MARREGKQKASAPGYQVPLGLMCSQVLLRATRMLRAAIWAVALGQREPPGPILKETREWGWSGRGKAKDPYRDFYLSDSVGIYKTIRNIESITLNSPRTRFKPSSIPTRVALSK